MPMFICPLCQKHSTTKSLHTDIEPDIIEVTYRGGRAMIQVNNRESVLNRDDDTTQAVASRLLKILNKLIEADVIDRDHLADILGIRQHLHEENRRLSRERDEYYDRCMSAESELSRINEQTRREENVTTLLREMAVFFRHRIGLDEENRVILTLIDVNDEILGFKKWFLSMQLEHRYALLGRVRIKNQAITSLIESLENQPRESSLIKLLGLDIYGN